MESAAHNAAGGGADNGQRLAGDEPVGMEDVVGGGQGGDAGVELGGEAGEGQIAAFAKATDQAEAARRWAAELDAEAAKLLVAAEHARIEVSEAEPDNANIEELEQRSAEAERAAAAAYRTYVDAKARSVELAARAAELNPAGPSRSPDPDIWRSSSSRSDS